MLASVSRLANSEQGKGKNEGNELDSKWNRTCGEAHRKLGNTLIAPG
jgi:hypothetical protein